MTASPRQASRGQPARRSGGTRKPTTARGRKPGGSRKLWAAILVASALAGGALWVASTRGARERFMDWFYGEGGGMGPEAAPAPGDQAPDAVPAVSRPVDPLWDGPARTVRTSLTLKQASALVNELLGGRARQVRNAQPDGRYLFEVEGGRRMPPFDVDPIFVEVGHRVLSGPLAAGGGDGFVVSVAVEDPEGPEWTRRYVGAVAWSGRPDRTGRRLGAAALQAPGGWFVRTEALDAEGDGTLETLLEVEYRGPQGVLMREASVWSLASPRSRKLWSGMTLDDAPGLGAEEARAWEVRFVSAAGGRGTDLEVTERRRTFEVAADLSRTLQREDVVGRTRVELSGGTP